MSVHLIVFSVSLGATMLSSMSGGGTSAVCLPVFLWAGIPLPQSIAVLKVSALFWTPISACNYLRHKTIDWKFMIIFTLIGLAGVYAGVQLIVETEERVLKPIIGLLILGLGVHTYLRREPELSAGTPAPGWRRMLVYPAALAMGIYESILGSGNGVLFAALTGGSRRYDLLTALGYYFATAFFWVSFAAALLVLRGYFDAGLMAAGITGSMIGSYAGSSITVRRGNRFTKKVFLAVAVVLGLRLIIPG